MLSASISTPTSANAVPSSHQSDMRVGRTQRSWWQSLLAPRSSKVEEIRKFMLAQLTAVNDSEQRAALAEQIIAATQTQDLWSLRGDLTAALVQAHGELLARRRMTDITFMFAGLLECDRRNLLDTPEAGTEWPANPQGRSAAERAGQAQAH